MIAQLYDSPGIEKTLVPGAFLNVHRYRYAHRLYELFEKFVEPWFTTCSRNQGISIFHAPKQSIEGGGGSDVKIWTWYFDLHFCSKVHVDIKPFAV